MRSKCRRVFLYRNAIVSFGENPHPASPGAPFAKGALSLRGTREQSERIDNMNIVCLDMEGVLVPEIWIAFAEETGIPELRRTTRDEPDYSKLMRYRLDILKEHGLGLKEIQAVIAKIDPLPGAKEFLDKLRSETQVVILSDTFEDRKSTRLNSSHRG